MKANNLNIRLLIDGCLQGNTKSQRSLYEHYYGYGMNIALRYAKNYQEAEEMLNDAFLKIFAKLGKYDPEYPFEPWFRRIVVNAAIDYHRKFQKHKDVYCPGDMPEVAVEAHLPKIGPEDDALGLIQQLPPAYRMVFNLYVIEGYKHHEIAEKLDISVGTSKSNLARAKAKLRALWIKEKGNQKKVNQHG